MTQAFRIGAGHRSFFRFYRKILLQPRYAMFIFRTIRHMLSDDDGATTVEYAVMLALILAAVIGAVTMLGTEAGGWWGGIDSSLQQEAWGN